MISTLTVENPKNGSITLQPSTNFDTSIHGAISSGDHAMFKTIAVSYVSYRQSEMNGNGHEIFKDFRHGLGHGLGQSHDFGNGHVRKSRTRTRTRVSAHLCRQ